jgi:hypothetical protein
MGLLVEASAGHVFHGRRGSACPMANSEWDWPLGVDGCRHISRATDVYGADPAFRSEAH